MHAVTSSISLAQTEVKRRPPVVLSCPTTFGSYRQNKCCMPTHRPTHMAQHKLGGGLLVDQSTELILCLTRMKVTPKSKSACQHSCAVTLKKKCYSSQWAPAIHTSGFAKTGPKTEDPGTSGWPKHTHTRAHTHTHTTLHHLMMDTFWKICP
jgi:hypothetical protein